MPEKTLMNEDLYSPDFLGKLLSFNDLRGVIMLLSFVFGPSSLREARQNLKLLRKDLSEVAAKNEYPPEYTGDRTMTKEVDYIVSHIEEAISRLEDKYYPDITD